jgi:hypothetical protein
VVSAILGAAFRLRKPRRAARAAAPEGFDGRVVSLLLYQTERVHIHTMEEYNAEQIVVSVFGNDVVESCSSG